MNIFIVFDSELISGQGKEAVMYLQHDSFIEFDFFHLSF